MGNEQSAAGGAGARGNLPQGMQAMGSQLQRKFAKGVQYNMKVIIKGDRNTGKSCLLKRLQGGTFLDSYTPTQEIQAASIHWNYRASDDVVKVEVWDVVDKSAAQRKRSGSLKLHHEEPDPQADPSSPSLDADFLDVYKNTNGVIMTLDICKAWTWKYVQREIERVPHPIPVIVLGNFRDMGEHRVVDREEVEYFLESLDRPKDAGEIRYAEVSMKNAFGLKYLHKFFNLPFLRLQRATLLAQLKTNEQDLASTLEELNFHLESEEQDYDTFVSGLEKRRKENAERLAQQKAAAEAAAAGGAAAAGAPQTAATGSKPSPTVAARTSQTQPSPKPQPTASTAAATRAQPTGQPARTGAASAPPAAAPKTPTTPATAPAAATSATSTTPARPTSSSPAPSSGPSLTQRFASKLGFRKEAAAVPKVDEAAAQIAAAREARLRGAKPSAENVDDFVPEGGLTDDFLGDGGLAVEGTVDDDDDESDDGRPVIAGYDDLDSDDADASAYTAKVTAPAEDVSDDDDDDDVGPTAVAKVAASKDDGDDEDDDGDMPSVDVVVAVDDDYDSEPSPPPVRKTTKSKAPASKPASKPIVYEEAIAAYDEPEPSPPAARVKAARSSPKAKKSVSQGAAPAPAKKKPAKKAVAVSSSEPSDSDDNAGPVVAPLEGDSDDEIPVEPVPVVSTVEDDIDPGLQPSGFMDHWLDGGAMPPPMPAEPLQPISAASLMMADPLVPTASQPVEKKKKKKKTASVSEAMDTADGTEKKKKKKKKKPQEGAGGGGEGSAEVKRKKKKPKEEKQDSIYLL